MLQALVDASNNARGLWVGHLHPVGITATNNLPLKSVMILITPR